MSLVKEVMKGTVAWFSPKKGYGFITKDDGSGDVFLHWTNIQMEGFKCLKEGDPVTFELGENHAGAQCINVKLVNQ